MMYRSRPLLLLLKESRERLQSQDQVVRCVLLRRHVISKRPFSDSIKSAAKEEFDEKDRQPLSKKISSRKSSKPKLFHISDINREIGDAVRSPKSTSVKREFDETDRQPLSQKTSSRNSSKPKLFHINGINTKIGDAVGSPKSTAKQEEFGRKDRQPLSEKSSSKKSSLHMPFRINEGVTEVDDAVRSPKVSSSTEIKGDLNMMDFVLKRRLNKVDVNAEDNVLTETVNSVDQKTVDNLLKEIEENELTKSEKTNQIEKNGVIRKNRSVLNNCESVLKNEFNLLDSADAVESRLISIINGSERPYYKTTGVICALKKLEKLGLMQLGIEMEQKLDYYLNERSQVCKMKFYHLTEILDYFMKGSSKDNVVANTILHEMCWRLRSSGLNETLNLTRIVQQRLSTDKRKEVNRLGNKRLIECIDSMSSPKMLLLTMSLLNKKDEGWQRAEEEALNLLQTMDSFQTYQLIYLLALKRSRNGFLISLASKQLQSQPIELNISQLKNLFFACAVLRINNQALLNDIAVKLIELLKDNWDRSRALSVLRSCSTIGWNSGNLTNLIMENICNMEANGAGKEEMTLSEIDSIVTSIGRLNLVKYGDFGQREFEHLLSKNLFKPTETLNLVHSLACLKKCDRTSVEEVISLEFYSLLEQSREGKQYSFKEKDRQISKLLNLYGYLNVDLNGVNTGMEQHASEWRKQLQELVEESPLQGLAKVVGGVLIEIAPLETYANVNVVSKYGYVIDFEIFVDKNTRPVRLDNIEGMQKVWIKMLDYRCYVQGGDKPEYTGCTDMMLRHLNSEEDVAIIYVPYFEWSQYDKKIDHLIYLETKLKAAVHPQGVV